MFTVCLLTGQQKVASPGGPKQKTLAFKEVIQLSQQGGATEWLPFPSTCQLIYPINIAWIVPFRFWSGESRGPQKYVFFLACCYQPGCIHPMCSKESQDSEQVWYPGGPHLKYVPIPTPDPDRPYGDQEGQDCEGVCCGHYSKPDKLWQHANSGEKLGKPQPPSEVILAVYREHKCVPSEAIIQQVARNVLLPSEEVKFWFVHLHQTHENRRKGAQKAAQTRREKSQNQTNRGKRSRKEKEKINKRKQRKTSRNASDEDDDDENVLCVVCDLHDPLQNTTDEMVSWVQCDGCLSWCHIGCTQLEENNVPDRWLCMRCSEVWC